MNYQGILFFIQVIIPLDKIAESLGPFCLKGTKIMDDKAIEVTIERAISQLSYAFIEKLIASFEEQTSNDMFKNTIFLNIPIVITNADLFILNPSVTTKDIKNSSSINEVATKHDFLFFHNKPT